MNDLLGLVEGLRPFLPLLGALAVVSLVLGVGHWLLIHRARHTRGELPFAGTLVMLVLTALSVVAVVLTLPVKESTRGQLLSLLGIVLTALIALSSTSFVANAMAGLLLRLLRNFHPGDFVRIGDHFGRVTERGLFHTELQTEDRDLTTLPNLYLATNPVTVVRESGTMVTATVSLGYAVHHATADELLRSAAEAAGLEEPFVRVLELGAFSVTYRTAGFLRDVKQILDARSRLRACILHTLHAAGVEIMSPAIVDHRPKEADALFVPAPGEASAEAPPGSDAARAIVFDKAEEASQIEALRRELESIAGELAEASPEEAERLERRRDEIRARLREHDEERGEPPQARSA